MALENYGQLMNKSPVFTECKHWHFVHLYICQKTDWLKNVEVMSKKILLQISVIDQSQTNLSSTVINAIKITRKSENAYVIVYYLLSYAPPAHIPPLL